MLGIKIFVFFIYIIILIKRIIKKQSVYLAFWILPLFMFVWKTFSLLYLENGVYATELYRKTYYLGTDLPFISLMTIFFASSLFFTRILDFDCSDLRNINILPNNVTILNISKYLHLIVLLYLYLNVFLTGIFFPSSTLVYMINSRLPFVNTLGSTVMFLLLTVDGVIFFCLKKHKKMILAMFLLSILYMFIIGAKFSGIYQYIIFFITPYIFNYALSKKIKIGSLLKPKVVITVILIVLCMLIYSLYVYSSKSGNAQDLLFARLFDMQSGTLWGINEYVTNNHIEWFGDSAQRDMEIQGLLNNWNELDSRIGLGKVMFLIAPKQIANDYILSGLRFSGWFLVVSILSFGYIGSALLCILLGLLFSLICVSLKNGFKRGDIFIMSVGIFEYCHFYDYYRIGNFSILLNPLSIICIIIMIYYLIINYNRIGRSVNK